MRKLKKIIITIKDYGLWFFLLLKSEFKFKYKKYDNQGKHVVAIGNGPSAAFFPYEKYRNMGFEFLCVNFFALDKNRFFAIKPRYYCCIDPLFCSDINALNSSQLKLIDILEEVNWEIIFICLPNTKLPIKNKNISYHYINNCVLKGEISNLKAKLYDRNIATHGYQNVMVAALYYLTMSKVQKVVLTGVENDWHRELTVDYNNDVYRETIHFYGTEKFNITKNGTLRKGELYKYFYYYYITLYNYHLNSQYALHTKTCIQNSCSTSYIDVYEKIDL